MIETLLQGFFGVEMSGLKGLWCKTLCCKGFFGGKISGLIGLWCKTLCCKSFWCKRVSDVPGKFKVTYLFINYVVSTTYKVIWSCNFPRGHVP